MCGHRLRPTRRLASTTGITTPTFQPIQNDGVMVLAETDRSWSVARSAELYGLDRWGDPYFSINSRAMWWCSPVAIGVDRSISWSW